MLKKPLLPRIAFAAFTVTLSTQMIPVRASLLDGLVAYYPFDGNANDETSFANNATPHNAILTTDRFNQADRAYALNGANAFLSAPNKDYLTFPNSGDFTISIWAALNTIPNPVTYLIGMDNGAGDPPKWIFAYGQLALPAPPGYSDNYIQFDTTGGTGSGFGYFLGSAPLTPDLGTWHQYMVTKAGTTYTTYVDGVAATPAVNYENDHDVLLTGVTGPSAIVSGITAPLTIGWAEGLGYVDGKVDDVRIYDRALSSDEARALYDAESTQPVPESTATAWLALPVALLVIARRRQNAEEMGFPC